MTKFKKMADEIVSHLGGLDNIQYLNHCITRLRINAKDQSKINKEAIENIDGVIGINEVGDQLQVIIGQDVDKVFKEINFNDQVMVESVQESRSFSLKVIGQSILDVLSGSITPLIPIIMISAFFKMILAVCGQNMLNIISEGSDLWTLFNMLGDVGFYFFPVFLGYSAGKKFNVSIPISMFLGAALLHPTLIELASSEKPFSVFGISTMLQSYVNSVLPVIIAIWLLSYVEKWLKKVIPVSLSTIFVPALSILIMFPITLLVVGPFGNWLGEVISNAILAMGESGGVLKIIAVGLVGAFWQFLVLSGMHFLMITTMIVMLTETGSDSFVLLGAVAASFAVSGMALGAALKLKDKKNKSLAYSYMIAGLIGGVTEPAMYGVAIKYKKPFLGMIAGGFVGAALGAILNVIGYQIIPVANVFILTSFIGGTNVNFINGVIYCLVAFVVAAIVTYVYGLDEENVYQVNN